MNPYIYAGLPFDEKFNITRVSKTKKVINEVCELKKVSTDDILSRRRYGELVYLRHLVFYMAYISNNPDDSVNGKLTLQKIGDELGFDHATVLHGIRRIKNELSYDIVVQDDVDTLRKILGIVTKID